MTPAVIGAIAAKHRASAGAGLYWNAADKSADMGLSTDTTTAWRSAGTDGHAIVRGIQGRSSGKRYVEFYSPQDRGIVPAGGSYPGLVDATFALNGVGTGDGTGGLGIQFRRYVGPGDSAYFGRNGGGTTNMSINVNTTDGWGGLAVDFAAGQVWIVIDGTWYLGLTPSGSPSSGSTTVPVAGTLYPAVSTYYPEASYPDNTVSLRVLASEMSIGASAFNPGGVLDGFSPWGA